MIEITREKLEKLYNNQGSQLKKCGIITLISWVIAIGYFKLDEFVPESIRSFTSILALAVFIFPFIYLGITKKKLIPAGNGAVVQEAFAYIKNDYLSDSAINFMYQKIGQASNYSDKTKLTLLLSNLYVLRGQYDDAINLLNSVDRSQFQGYPTIGMNFYDDTISLYSELEDNDSVLAAYKDAEPFINECAERNYVCCSTALNILICTEKANGNYRKALDLKLMKNSFENQFNRTAASDEQSTPLSRILRGSVFFETAELYYLCGDYANAGKYLDIGGPLLNGCPQKTALANKLSDKIRQALNNKNIQ